MHGAMDLRSKTSLPSLSPATTTPHAWTSSAEGKYADLTLELLAAWPSNHDLDLITSIPAGLSTYLDSGLCITHSTFAAENLPSPREILCLPPSDSHPVLIARKLLILGRFLQGILPSSFEDLKELSRPHQEIMNTVVDKAVSLVTTNDDLTDSIEGIECIMLECMYHNYAGNLHKAWLTAHRAIAVAQMLGLHRGPSAPPLKMLEQKTRAVLNPDQVCFRLVNFDRYLSLMLGLPQSSLETNCASPSALEGCSPVDKMERIHCAVAGRILQRKDSELHNMTQLHEVDRLLQKAAAELPPQWWLTPSLMPVDRSDKEVYDDTIRMNSQFAHYHLLLRLHLPYMLRSSSGQVHSHSRITAVTSSREMLSRYIVFRTANPAHCYCRGTDFLAFIATAVMCLAHITYHSQRLAPSQSDNHDTPFSFLQHGRLNDRGMMERTLDILDSATRAGPDPIASKVGRMIRHLLTVESDAANGITYSTSQFGGGDEGIECTGKVTNHGKALQVHIPYFGTIKFERGTISKSSLPVSELSMGPSNHYLLQTELRHDSHPSPLNSQALPLQSDATSVPNEYLCFDSDADTLLQSTDSVQDGDLQGIDIALFDSLFRGTELQAFTEENIWTQWTDMQS